MTITFRPARLADIPRMQLREEDAAEVALYGMTPEEGIRSSILDSRMAVAAFDGPELVAFYGYSIRDHTVIPWMLSSDAVGRHGKTAIRVGRALVKSIRSIGLPVHNWIGKTSHRNRGFVKRLGFRIVPDEHPLFDTFHLPE